MRGGRTPSAALAGEFGMGCWGDYPIALPRNTPHAPHCGASLRIIMLRRAKLDNGRFVDAEGGRVPGPGPSSASLLAPFDDLAGSEESSSDSEPAEEQHTPMVDGGLLVLGTRGRHWQGNRVLPAGWRQ